MPNLTVIMPAHNAVPYLTTAVSSTLKALPRDSELVVLDDASSDETPEVLERLSSDQRLRVIRSDSPLGVSRALNRLLEMTDSQYVARMDADDICMSWRFRAQLARVQRTEFLFSSVVRIGPSGRPMARTPAPVPISAGAMGLTLLLGNVLVHPTMLASRRAIDQLGGYRQSASEDYDLWMRAVCAGMRLEKTSAVTLAYRTHGDQVSGSQSWRARSADTPLISAFTGLVERELGLHINEWEPQGWSRFGLYRSITGNDFESFKERFMDAETALPLVDRVFVAARRRKRFAQNIDSGAGGSLLERA